VTIQATDSVNGQAAGGSKVVVTGGATTDIDTSGGAEVSTP
jgi:hypothetical protein